MNVEQLKAELIKKGFTEQEAEDLFVKPAKAQQSEFSRAQDAKTKLEGERDNVLAWGNLYYSVVDEYNKFKPDIEKLKASKTTVEGTPAAEVREATGMSKTEYLDLIRKEIKESTARQSEAYTNLTKFALNAADEWRTKYNKKFDMDKFDTFMAESKITDPQLALERFAKPEEELIQKRTWDEKEKSMRAEIEKEVRSRYPDAPIREDLNGADSKDKSNPWATDPKEIEASRATNLRDEFMAGLHEPAPSTK